MKTLKQIFNIVLILAIVSLATQNANGQERQEKFEKTYQIKSSGEFSFACYDTDLKVNTWKKDEVKLMGEIIIEGGDKEDQDKVIEIFKNPQVTEGTNSLSIETHMASSTVVIFPIIKMTLVNGERVKIKKFTAKYTLWIPESIAFNLKSKYNDVDIATLTGKVQFELHDVDLTMLSYGNDSRFDMKYSSASIGKGGDAILNIYDSELEAIQMENVEITSKYSEIEIETINALDFNSYDDELTIEKINSLESEAKYTNYTINGDIKNCILNFYDSDIDAQNIEKLIFTGKYSSIEAGNAGKVVINTIYDSNIRLGTVGEFSCTESKYDEMKFEQINRSLTFGSAYELALEINKVGTAFEKFKGEFKYGHVNLPINSSIEFYLKFQTTYGDVDFPKNRLRVIDMNFDDSKKFFEGETTENAPCKIEFIAYDTEFDLD